MTVPPFYTEVARLYDFGAPAPEVAHHHFLIILAARGDIKISPLDWLLPFILHVYVLSSIASDRVDNRWKMVSLLSLNDYCWSLIATLL